MIGKRKPIRIVKIPKELKPVPVPPKPKLKYTFSDKLQHWGNKTRDFLKGIFVDIWNIVRTIPKIPETVENIKKASSNTIWVVVGLIVLVVIIILIK